MNKTLSALLSFLTTLLTPVFLILLGIRILLTPFFPELEYRMPGFPEDIYGFTQAERLKYAKVSIEYLNNDAGPEFLSNLTFDDDSPLYKDREVSHMLDVKVLIQVALKVWGGAFGVLILLGIVTKLTGSTHVFLTGARRGGWLTLILTVSLGIIASIDFWTFFAEFHHIFFEGTTWIFEYSDTLIRLFPMRLWQDAFIMEAIIVIGGGLALAFGLKPKLD
ncbi:MAG: TIGR01906 family membrane protein [Anaerolineae bacterium]|mgnify:CR=1 FL=1|jgi:integral membrane protein (TIGR01906 family)|nr:TIGR01906 family membrane protein [Anaerolineae bacterium]MBT7074445.1 TIGR01906 family membrane protein [Anaerolineae bacterium]MBT7781944.1 TIGR01906 family membrane protein [Anaerolineae bacterium]